MEKVKTVTKKWGLEEWLATDGDFVMKKLVVNKGKQMSVHFHEIKDENWFIHKGSGVLVLDYRIIPITEGMSVRIKPKQVHSVLALEELHIVEASTTELEDSTRVVEL